jgi:hypothetical protein
LGIVEDCDGESERVEELLVSELLAATCDACGEPMLPNVSTLDRDGCLWICINPSCPEQGIQEVEPEDLVEAGVPTGLAGRLDRVLAFYTTPCEAQPRQIENAQNQLSRLVCLLDIGHLIRSAGDVVGQLDEELVVSFLSNDFAEAQHAKQALAAVEALLGTIGRTVADATSRLQEIDPDLPGSMPARDA